MGTLRVTFRVNPLCPLGRGSSQAMCVQISSKVINQTRGNGGRRERLGQYLPVVLICLIHSDLCTVKGSFSLTPPPPERTAAAVYTVSGEARGSGILSDSFRGTARANLHLGCLTWRPCPDAHPFGAAVDCAGCYKTTTPLDILKNSSWKYFF